MFYDNEVVYRECSVGLWEYQDERGREWNLVTRCGESRSSSQAVTVLLLAITKEHNSRCSTGTLTSWLSVYRPQLASFIKLQRKRECSPRVLVDQLRGNCDQRESEERSLESHPRWLKRRVAMSNLFHPTTHCQGVRTVKAHHQFFDNHAAGGVSLPHPHNGPTNRLPQNSCGTPVNQLWHTNVSRQCLKMDVLEHRIRRKRGKKNKLRCQQTVWNTERWEGPKAKVISH